MTCCSSSTASARAEKKDKPCAVNFGLTRKFARTPGERAVRLPTALRNMLKNRAMLVLLALCVPAHGQMYRWPDKDGRIHYSDVPPPGAKGGQRAAKPAATRTPAQAQDAMGENKARQTAVDNAGPAGGPFRPEEELAAGVVCRIALMEGRHCATPLNRYCSLDELVKGVEGNRAIAFKDPRTDSNYQYRVDIRGNTVAISADA